MRRATGGGVANRTGHVPAASYRRLSPTMTRCGRHPSNHRRDAGSLDLFLEPLLIWEATDADNGAPQTLCGLAEGPEIQSDSLSAGQSPALYNQPIVHTRALIFIANSDPA